MSLPIIEVKDPEARPVNAMEEAMTDEQVWRKTDEGLELIPYKQIAQSLVNVHRQFMHHCRALRMATKLGKHLQKSIEDSVAKKEGFVFYGGMWILTHKGYIPEKVKRLLDGEVKAEEMEEPESEPSCVVVAGDGIPDVETVKKIVDPFL